MVQYRRNLLQGGTYFFTMALHNRKARHLIEHIDLLRIAMKKTNQNMSYTTLAIVVLPEHIHAIWKLPDNDINYPGRWRLIKSYFSQSLLKQESQLHKNSRGQYDVWQPRYWEHTIKDERDLETHIDYIHYNPVKHGLVQRPADWPFSSFHSFVRKNILEPDWGASFCQPRSSFDE